MRIKHQLQTVNYYPDWTIEHLFTGTFNPEKGEPVEYYYGRKRNQFWDLISKIFNDDFNTNDSKFFEKLQKHKIACIDMINSVEVPDHKSADINGNGYQDTKIINTCVARDYNTMQIQNIIKNNPNVKVYTTWGVGSKLKEWREEVNKIKNTIPLVSPSMAARVPKGENKFEFMLKNWQENIKIFKNNKA